MTMAHSVTLAAVQRRARRCAANTHQGLDRRLASLATIVSAAPLVGLSGTILGIYNSFPACGADRWTCMAAVVDRLAGALAPAAFGLAIALPTLWAYQSFRGQLEAFDVEMANATLDLTNRLALHMRRVSSESR